MDLPYKWDGHSRPCSLKVEAKALSQEPVRRRFVDALRQFVKDEVVELDLHVSGRTYHLSVDWTSEDFAELRGTLKVVAQRAMSAAEALQRRVAQGEVGEANRPSWLRASPYKPGQVFEEERIVDVWSMLCDYLDGFSLEDIATRLADSGGPVLGPQSVAQAIFSPSLTGSWGGCDEDPSKPQGDHRPIRPAVLEPATFRHLIGLRALREDAPKRLSDRLLLSDLLHCARCGEKVTIKFDDRRSRVPLKCHGGCTMAALGSVGALKGLERQLFAWLGHQGDFLRELENPLRVASHVLIKAVRTYTWDPKNPLSLESHVHRVHGSRTATVDAADAARALDALLVSLETDDKSPEKVDLRRRLHQILRKRVAKVFIDPGMQLRPERRAYDALRFGLDLGINEKLPAKSDRTRRRIGIQLVGHSDPQPAFELDTAALSAALPGRMPRREEPFTGNPKATSVQQITVGDIDGWESAFLALEPDSEWVPCSKQEPWAWYVPQEGGTEWGIHLCGCGLDSAARVYWLKQGGGPGQWPTAAQMALGMPLHYLQFFARLDAWASSGRSNCTPGTFRREIVHPLPPVPEKSTDLDDLQFLLRVFRGSPASMANEITARPLLEKLATERPLWLPAVLAVGQVMGWSKLLGGSVEAETAKELQEMSVPYSLWRLATHEPTWAAMSARFKGVTKSTPAAASRLRASVDAGCTQVLSVSRVPLHLHGSGQLVSALLLLHARRSK